MTVTEIQPATDPSPDPDPGQDITTSGVLYLLDTTPTAFYKSSSAIDYYTFPAIVDGVLTVVKATTGNLSSLNTLSGVYDIHPGTLCKVTYTNGKLTPGSTTPIYTATASDSNGAFVYGTGISAPSNNHVTIADISYALNSYTYVFYISADHSTITMGLGDSIPADTKATITAVTNAASVIAAGGTPTEIQQNTLYAVFIQLADQ